MSDLEMQTMDVRFPYNTPQTKEAAYFRTLFHSHFPNNLYGNGIESTVPGGPSIACSTAKAIEVRSTTPHLTAAPPTWPARLT